MRGIAATMVMAAVLGLTACGEEREPTAPAVSTGAAEDEPPVPALSDSEAEALAFQAAWEAAAPVTASDPRHGDEDDLRWPEPVAGRFEFREGSVIPLGAGLFALVSSGHVEGADPGTPGAVAIHYLRREGDGFRRVDVDPLFLAGGQGGEPPAFELSRELTPAPALVIRTGAVRGGRSCVTADLVELTPSHPVLRAEAIPLGHDAADGDEQDWSGALQPGRRGRDFGVQYSGADDARATWVLTSEGVYRAQGQPRLPGC